MPDPKAILIHLVALYGEDEGRACFERLIRLMETYRPHIPPPVSLGLSESDSILITYGDQVRQPDLPPLQTLGDFCERHLRGIVSGIHILPFYPYSSDDGFSVIDYYKVNPTLGDWEHICHLGKSFRLMFDLVINHVSAASAWFQGFLQGQPPYCNYFITVTGQPDLSRVVRPRTLPLLTTFSTSEGEKAVWTTFSSDQIDLNYHNPQVLLEMLEILLFYATQGASFIRLDAIAYLWKEIGTSCIHLPQTHRIVQIIRLVLDQVAPHVQIITETNVPHQDNISYFGDGHNEAQMVYNFALPPLTLHTLHTGNATALSLWATNLTLPSSQVTFFNFLASHDGIGVTPVNDLLPQQAIQALVDKALMHGGLVSYRSNPDGTQSPYELNINYFDALSNPNGDEPLQVQINRFIAAHLIMFSLIGMPAIYFHSLFGSRGWPQGVALTSMNRTINRQKFTLDELETSLSDPTSLRSQVFRRLTDLLRRRSEHPAFHPHGSQRVVDAGNQVFALLRSAPHNDEHVLCLQNVAAKPVQVHLNWESLPLPIHGGLIDLVSGNQLVHTNGSPLTLEAYQGLWLGKQLLS